MLAGTGLAVVGWPAGPGHRWQGLSDPMVPMTGVLLVLLSLALVLGSGRRSYRGAWAASRVLGALAAVLAGAVLVEYLAGVDLRIDGLLARGARAGAQFPGRPSPYTALALLNLGLGTAAVRGTGPSLAWRWVAPALASVAMAVGTMASLGYAAFLNLPMAGGPNMAPLAAAAALLLGLAVLLMAAWRARAERAADGVAGAWVPGWVGGPVGAAAFTATLVGWVLIMHLQLAHGAADVWPMPTASVAIITIGAALGLASGAAASLLAQSRLQVRRTRVWADSLAATQVRLRALFQQAAVGIELLSLEGRVLEVNDKLCEILETPRAKLLGRGFHDLTHPTDRQAEEKLLRRLMERRAPSYTMEKRYLRSDGTEVWTRFTSSLALDGQGRAMYRIGVVEDIQARRRAEEALRESEARKSAMLESALDCVISMDEHGRVIEFNPAAEQVFGYPRERAMGRRVSELIIPERLRGAHESGLARLLRSGEGTLLGRRVEMPAVRSDGAEFPVELSISATRLHDGKYAFTAFVRDITQRLRGEADAAQLAAIVASSDDAIISKDLDGFIRSFNAAAERMFGYSASEAVGKPITILIPPERLSEEDHILGVIRSGRAVEHFETVRVRKDGRRIDVSLTVSPVRDQAGHVVGASKIARDITARKREEAELALYREDLERQVHARTAQLERSQEQLRSAERMAALGTLSAGLGHDMGNLLLPVRMRLEALSQEHLPPHVKEDLNAIAASAVYLQRLATSLRLFAVDPGEDGSEAALAARHGTDLNQWWKDTEPLLRAVVPRGVQLEVTGGDAARPFVSGRPAISPQRLMQSVFNLVQNAAEAIQDGGQPRGVIRLSSEGSEDGSRVRITVEDNGPGMTPEVLRRCMEPFFSTKTRRISTGMGLSMVRGFAEQAGGKVEVSSDPGRCTRFVLDLPAASGGPVPSTTRARRACRAAVTVHNPRAKAFVEWALRSLGVEAVLCEGSPPRDVDVWVVDASVAGEEALGPFVEGVERNGHKTCAVVLGVQPTADGTRMNSGRVLYVGSENSPTGLRRTLQEAIERSCLG